MNIKELIALASIRSGKRQGQLGQEMGHNTKTRISKIGAGQLNPEASEVIYLAQQANLPPVETLAEIEADRNPQLAGIWLKLNGVSEQWKAEHKAWLHS